MNEIKEFVKPWLWPRQLQCETSLVVRLGRVFHWSFAVLAAFAVSLSIVVSASAYQKHRPSWIEITKSTENWTNFVILGPSKSNPEMTMYEIDAPNGLTYTVEGPHGSTQRQLEITIRNEDPKSVLTWWDRLEVILAGLLCGLIILLAGRGLRYVLAKE